MKSLIKISSLVLLGLLMACGGNGEKKEKDPIKVGQQSQTEKKAEPKSSSSAETTAEEDMANLGIGPVKSIDIEEGIDQSLANRGKEVFGNLCTACHKMDKKFVGPSLVNVTDRRTPEWIMNMILNPEEMIKKDPIAKRLLIENNMAVMANQNVSREDARAILEYFRKYDKNN
ncbi:c-type cytochrome [Psychroflexus sediminis]|uniref:Putative heme-binding domain-containing protein n=1 Tax=Psychroflexus sediminis TaxID=470826 RepID=A0A1G7ZFL2_9FLAO|nr:c-type cytochrome [Psychroflexus sediminis]SDH07316.1 putative heme-binding domain-containing protein [Psychroflexus sediminis]